MWFEMSTGSPSQCQGQQATANALSTAEKSERLTDLTRGVAEQHVVGAVEPASIKQRQINRSLEDRRPIS